MTKTPKNNEEYLLTHSLLGMNSGGTTTHTEYTDEYVQAIADRAFNILGENPDIDSFAAAMKEGFARNGDDDLVQAIENGVLQAAAGSDGRISLSESANVTQSLIDSTRETISGSEIQNTQNDLAGMSVGINVMQILEEFFGDIFPELVGTLEGGATPASLKPEPQPTLSEPSLSDPNLHQSMDPTTAPTPKM